MKTIVVRVPKVIPRLPLAYSNDDPVFLWETRRERFLILHEFGYRWRPRLGRWDIPKHPSQRYKVKVGGA